MNWLLLVAGALIVVWILVEGLWTTLWIDGNGAPLTSRAASFIWVSWKKIFKQKQHKVLSLAGPLVLFLTLASWIVLLWVGWTLIFYADPGAIATSAGKLPDFSGTLWYVAYTMFTVGNGDFKPQADAWQLLSSFVAFSGMALVTLSITYFFQIVSAVVTKRSFAAQVSSIALQADEFVKEQWTGKDLGAIELQLNSLSGQLSTLNEQHLAYPILHYYHAKDAAKSSAVALAVLDDALTILQHCFENKYKPAQTILKACRASISTYLQTLKAAHIEKSDQTPPLPDWQKLADAGVPVCSQEKFEQVFREHVDRRKVLLGLIQNAAWKWPSKLET